MEFTQSDRDMLTQMKHDTGVILERLGENDTGLCGTVKANCSRIRKLEIIIAFAAGGGGITGGVIGISKLLGG